MKKEILLGGTFMAKNEVGFIVIEDYIEWIEDIKKRIKSSQIKASVKVNDVVLDLYWNIGKDIVEKQAASLLCCG